MAISAIFALQCLCIPGVAIVSLMGLAMAVSLYKLMDEVGEDSMVFQTLFIGVVLFTGAQILSFVHGPIHHFKTVKYIPSLRTTTQTLELVSYTLIFWSGLRYFERFADV
ncbi:MAG: hypothetical protein ABEK01_02200 [Candidatus Nanohaloarchaea archaeon]